jgi:hypothetical protein
MRIHKRLFSFDADADPAFHSDAGPASQNDADPCGLGSGTFMKNEGTSFGGFQ